MVNEEEIKTQEKKQSKEKLFKILSSIVGFSLLITLIIIKVQVPDFQLFLFVGGIIVIVVLFLGFFFGFSIYRKFQENQEKLKGEDKLPSAITIEQADILITEFLRSPRYADYNVGWMYHKVYNAGEDKKSRILLVRLSPTPYTIAPFQYFIMNLHYPKELCSYVTQFKLNTAEISRTVNALAVRPMDSPDTRITEEESPLTGVKRRTVETTQKKKEAKKEEKKELE